MVSNLMATKRSWAPGPRDANPCVPKSPCWEGRTCCPLSSPVEIYKCVPTSMGKVPFCTPVLGGTRRRDPSLPTHHRDCGDELLHSCRRQATNTWETHPLEERDWSVVVPDSAGQQGWGYAVRDGSAGDGDVHVISNALDVGTEQWWRQSHPHQRAVRARGHCHRGRGAETPTTMC